MASEQRVFSIEHNRTDTSFHDVGVEFDAAVVEEANEPIPMVQAAADDFGNNGLRRDARELLAHGEFESEHPGYCGAQDTFYVGNLKGVGRVYQQTFIDTYSKVACAKLYDRKTPITAADMLNDRVVPFFDSQEVKLLRVLTDRGSEYCGNPERHEYELYLAIEDIDHSRTKAKSPQTNGICERFHKTVLNEFYRVAFRKKVYRSIDELQADLDLWIREYNEQRPHQGRWCFGKTPMQTFLDAMPMAKEKMIAA